ncbi:hypothetical protein KC336_g21235 [Hortaea werneckii]|nr:hypothetical protein KC336_g21235 [Hortaea werneckii]
MESQPPKGNTPAPSVPVESQPTQQTYPPQPSSSKGTMPAQSVPVESQPPQQTSPAQSSSPKGTMPAQSTPGESQPPVPTYPAQPSSPKGTMPAQSTPSESQPPAQTYPAESSAPPMETMPAGSMPGQSFPAQSMPTQPGQPEYSSGKPSMPAMDTTKTAIIESSSTYSQPIVVTGTLPSTSGGVRPPYSETPATSAATSEETPGGYVPSGTVGEGKPSSNTGKPSATPSKKVENAGTTLRFKRTTTPLMGLVVAVGFMVLM